MYFVPTVATSGATLHCSRLTATVRARANVPDSCRAVLPGQTARLVTAKGASPTRSFLFGGRRVRKGSVVLVNSVVAAKTGFAGADLVLTRLNTGSIANLFLTGAAVAGWRGIGSGGVWRGYVVVGVSGAVSR